MTEQPSYEHSGQPAIPLQPGGYEQPGEYPPPPAPTPPPARASGRRVGVLIAVLVLVAVAVVAGIIGFVRSRPTPANAKVGDCMVGQSAKALKKIDCGDSKAEWTVVGRLEGKTEAETKDVEQTCAQWPETKVLFWRKERGTTGFVLCLAPKQ